MPLLSAIEIHTEDLQAIVEMLKQERVIPMQINIIDDGKVYTVRDSDDFLIGYVSKKVEKSIGE